MPHANEGFVPAKKLADNAQKWQLETEDGAQHSVSKKEYPTLERMSWLQLRFLHKDLVMLDQMSSGLIIHSLRERFKQNEIYTNVGTILISLNPYKSLPLYTPQVLNEYINRGGKKLAPHVFEVSRICIKRERSEEGCEPHQRPYECSLVAFSLSPLCY